MPLLWQEGPPSGCGHAFPPSTLSTYPVVVIICLLAFICHCLLFVHYLPLFLSLVTVPVILVMVVVVCHGCCTSWRCILLIVILPLQSLCICFCPPLVVSPSSLLFVALIYPILCHHCPLHGSVVAINIARRSSNAGGDSGRQWRMWWAMVVVVV